MTIHSIAKTTTYEESNMATVPDEEPTKPTFAELFPERVHDIAEEVVIGRGSLRFALLACLVGGCLAFAPMPVSVVGLVALLLLVAGVMR